MKSNIIDQPAQADEDRLNMRAYGDALSEFIVNAQSPLTIALQGEWGSGKTSLMNYLKKKLVDDDGAPYHGVWINTWQYAVLSDPTQAILRMLAGIVEQVSSRGEAVQPEDRKRVMKSFTKLALVACGNLAGNAIGLGAFGTEIRKACESGSVNSQDASGATGGSQIEELKERLQVHVDSCVNEKKRGFLFFIDDLDRIDPPVAVRVLELLKNIFDLRHCIFVLAIDYGVVVKGLKPKFGEMSVENEREFRSFFDKIIQLPFSMPVGAYKIDNFLLESLLEIGYIDSRERENANLCDSLISYALESVGTNPRSLKRLINTLSLIRLLILRTHTKDDDADFSAWKDVSFALVCLQIQYPQIYAALEQHPDFPSWDEKFAQSLRLASITDDERIKLESMDEFRDIWEQMLFRLCRKDAFLEARALSISSMLNRMKSRIAESQELVGDVVEGLLRLSAVTSVKSDPPKAVEVQSFSKSEYLKRLRDLVLGLGWKARPDGKSCWWRVFPSSHILMSSWQMRVQSNLQCELWLEEGSTDQRSPYLTPPCFHISHDGSSFQLKMWGEIWMAGSAKIFSGIDLKKAGEAGVLEEVEREFRAAWIGLGGVADIGHHEKNLWYNVTVPFACKGDLSRDSNFANSYRAAIMKTAEAFALLLPYRILSHA